MNDPTKNAALDEYREAAAQLRHTMAAQAEAREAQILANLKAADTSRKLIAAQERLERAEQALANPPQPDALEVGEAAILHTPLRAVEVGAMVQPIRSMPNGYAPFADATGGDAA